MRREPYDKSTPEFRAEALEELISGWSQDWEDRLGLDAKGSIIWPVNAADVMLLVRAIEALRAERQQLQQAVVYGHRWIERYGGPQNPKLKVLFAAQLEHIESVIDKIPAATFKELIAF